MISPTEFIRAQARYKGSRVSGQTIRIASLLNVTSSLHWWDYPITADERHRRLPGSVGLLLPSRDEYLSPRLQVVSVARNQVTTVASEGTTIVFSPSLYFSIRVFPSAFLTCCVTAALVMELLGIRSHG